MLNVLVPMSGPMPFFPAEEYPFPKPLVEIAGSSMIEYTAKNLLECGRDFHATFLVRNDYCRQFHLDDTIHLLMGQKASVVQVQADTKGALCTALLAIDSINNENPLLIMNFDQYFTSGFARMLDEIFRPEFDGGCCVFESVHPRWSFVKTNGEEVVEAAEKRPISKHAIAGIYGFARGTDFVAAAKSALIKDASHDGLFYISAALNEMVLMNKRLRAVPIDSGQYHSFYSPKKVEEFAGNLRRG
jgi:NDP-sugar pyrophosphorylase family protein